MKAQDLLKSLFFVIMIWFLYPKFLYLLFTTATFSNFALVLSPTPNTLPSNQSFTQQQQRRSLRVVDKAIRKNKLVRSCSGGIGLGLVQTAPTQSKEEQLLQSVC